jgi:hypothetical protein
MDPADLTDGKNSVDDLRLTAGEEKRLEGFQVMCQALKAFKEIRPARL